MAEERGEHSFVTEVFLPQKRGIDTQARQACVNILTERANTAPIKVQEKLKTMGVPISKIPSIVQISNMKAVIKLDRSDESPHRLDTLLKLTDYMSQHKVQCKEAYDSLGERNIGSITKNYLILFE